MNRKCYACCEFGDKERGPVRAYEGGDYHDECAFELGVPEHTMKESE